MMANPHFLRYALIFFYYELCWDYGLLRECLFSWQGSKKWPLTSGHELKHLPSSNQSINKELNPTTRTHLKEKAL